jgi:hypothetical protein
MLSSFAASGPEEETLSDYVEWLNARNQTSTW